MAFSFLAFVQNLCSHLASTFLLSTHLPFYSYHFLPNFSVLEIFVDLVALHHYQQKTLSTIFSEVAFPSVLGISSPKLVLRLFQTLKSWDSWPSHLCPYS